MALVLKDRVKETSTTTGTGPFTLSGAALGFLPFSSIGNGPYNTYYTITDGTANTWEVGIGSYTNNVLTRTTVLSNSSNTTTQISFAAGIKDVFITYPAGRAVLLDENNQSTFGTLSSPLYISPKSITTALNVPNGFNGMIVGPVTVGGGGSITIASGSRLVVV
jgi:hypothetical protein